MWYRIFDDYIGSVSDASSLYMSSSLPTCSNQLSPSPVPLTSPILLPTATQSTPLSTPSFSLRSGESPQAMSDLDLYQKISIETKKVGTLQLQK